MKNELSPGEGSFDADQRAVIPARLAELSLAGSLLEELYDAIA